jgi:hypothetical protein
MPFRGRLDPVALYGLQLLAPGLRITSCSMTF